MNVPQSIAFMVSMMSVSILDLTVYQLNISMWIDTTVEFAVRFGVETLRIFFFIIKHFCPDGSGCKQFFWGRGWGEQDWS